MHADRLLWPRRCGCRRDLDAARLLADQVRRREKLKKQELRLFQEEWEARMAGEQRLAPYIGGWQSACFLDGAWLAFSSLSCRPLRLRLAA